MLGYDLVGVVTAAGPQVDASLVGRRVAAVVKTGAWTTHALVDAGHLVPVPDGLDAADAETVVVNGITAWQMPTDHLATAVRETMTPPPSRRQSA